MGLGPLWFNVVLAIVFVCFDALNTHRAFTLAASTSGWSSTKKLVIRFVKEQTGAIFDLRRTAETKSESYFTTGTTTT